VAKVAAKVKVRYRKQRQGWEVDARRIGQGRPIFPTEEEAHAHALELVKDHGLGILQSADRDATLRTYYETTWLPAGTQELERKTVMSYTHLMTEHVLPVLGGMRLRAIRRRHVRALLGAKRAEGYAKNTVRLIRAVLSSVLTDAVEGDILDVNPALHLSRKHKGSGHTGPAEQQPNPMDWTQLAAFRTEALKAPWWPEGVLLLTMAATGIRPGEALAFQPGDLDVGHAQLRIERAWSLGKVKAPKTWECRKVDLNAATLAVLQQHRARLAKEALVRRWGDPAWLFPSEANTPLDEANLTKVFRRILKAAKLPHFRVYDLRHTFASLLLSAGAPLLYVSQQIGHRKPTTTLRYYAKWIPSGDQRWVELLAGNPVVLEPESGTTAVEGSRVAASETTGQETQNVGTAGALEAPAANGEPCRNRTYNLLIKSSPRTKLPEPRSIYPPEKIDLSEERWAA
jgi:integrase